MPRPEVDDTDMTPEQVHAALRRGRPVQIVTSRAEYESRVRELQAAANARNGLNLRITLAPVAHVTQNEFAAAPR